MSTTVWHVVVGFLAVSGALAWFGLVGFCLACYAYAETERTLDEQEDRS